ncbi:nuclear transport factor 2 family protein [Paraburkholderia sp. GAS32]|uniref:nuclear transport factor 2 family protein n=1 Tax=Paraburkholderia sp. GAS32 TaxID=3035129 RepID=UPI003D248E7B
MSGLVTQNELQSIERLFSDFAWFADRCDSEALANLFVPSGVLSVGGRESAGSDNIAADCRERFAVSDRKTRHMWSNLRVEMPTADTARTTAIQLTFETSSDDTPARLRVNDVIDELRKGASGEWRFVSRHIRCEMALALQHQ